jgi:DNA-binding NarL/FixJ family response regulator
LRVVGEADDPVAAARLAGTKPDVVVLSIPSHGEDVLAAVATVRGDLSEARILVLANPDSDAVLVYHALKAGATGCVSERANGDDLLKAIREVAAGEVVLTSPFLARLVDLIIANVDAGRPQQRKLDSLSEREREVLALVAAGHTNREIARMLDVSESTVRSHLHHILEKLQLANRVQAATYALKRLNGTTR